MIGLYILIGMGVAAAMHVEMCDRYPSRWTGYTMAAGLIGSFLLWPSIIVCLLTLGVMRWADR